MTDLMALAERVEVIDPTTDCDWTGIHSLNEAICAANTPPDGVRTVIPPDYLRSLDAADRLARIEAVMVCPETMEAVARAIYEAEPTTGYGDDETPYTVPWEDIADQWCGYPATYEATYTLATVALAALRELIGEKK